MARRLADATSPYLLQHADNPVDWWPWGPEALAEARRRDVPLLISIGYSSCHWCHVMARESFEDPATAALMNENFVCVKVDREERPDVDAVYMEATVALTGQGGWPMTVFCTPDGKPFFCGTYFPPTPRGGLPAFGQVLRGVAAAWRGRRGEVASAAAEIGSALAGSGAVGGSVGAAPDEAALAAAVRALAADFDQIEGGFGGAPKFPPSATLEQLLRHHARTTGGANTAGQDDEGPSALAMAVHTARRMAHGGIYDQIGGGFARYAVDATWSVPHFEKMLYDNAQLLRVYVHLWRATGLPWARRVAEETAGFLLAELRTPQGAFASSLDADSADAEGRHREGAYYVWTAAELVEVLGDDDGAWAAEVLGVTPTGTFEHGASVLQLCRDPYADPGDAARFADIRARLAAARRRRPRPGRDDKVVTAWNGLAVAALADAGALLRRTDLLAAARQAAGHVCTLHLRPAAEGPGSRLVRTSRDGRAGDSAGVLEDYADLAEGLFALYAATGEPRWLSTARRLLDTMLVLFDDGRGGLYDTAADAEILVRRPQDPTDNATPAGASAAAGALLTCAAYTGVAGYRDAAERLLGTVRRIAERWPRAAGWGLAVAEAWADGPREVAVVGPATDPATARLHRVALAGTAPGAVVALGDPARPPEVPLLADRTLVDGRPAAYVCRGFVCALPTTDADALAGAVGVQPGVLPVIV